METFDLDIINAVLINFNTCVGQDKFFTGFLSFCFDLKELVQNCFIILIFQEIFQCSCICFKLITDQGGNIVCQRMIAVH